MNYQIAKPCTQNWDEMAPSDNGRFCRHCQKEVYDLTSGKTLANVNANFCGRINVESPTEEISFKKLIWKQNPIKYILFTSLLLFTRNIKAQLLNKVDNAADGNINQNRTDSLIKTITISGVLTDKKSKESIPFANIVVYDQLNNQLGVTTTDIDGAYKIVLDKSIIKGKSISVKAVYIGYEPAVIKDIPLNSKKQTISISLSAGAVLVGDIVIVEPSGPVKPANKEKDDVFNSEYDNKRITPDMERDQLKKKPK